MDIDGLGGETVALLYQNHLVDSYADLYELKKEQIIPLERMAEKSAENLINGIEKSKQVPFEKVLYALGIRYVGETVAKKLAKHFKTLDALSVATFEELVAVDEIGEKIAKSIVEFFYDLNNIMQLKRLKNYGIQTQIIEDESIVRTDKLKGKTIVVSGVFTLFSRDELKKMIEDNGGKNGSSISSKTDYVVAGDNMGPSKLEKATQLKIPILTEQDFVKMLE